MDSDLSTLSYREIQGLAKTHGIPANKKRDVLIALLLEHAIAQKTLPSETTAEATASTSAPAPALAPIVEVSAPIVEVVAPVVESVESVENVKPSKKVSKKGKAAPAKEEPAKEVIPAVVQAPVTTQAASQVATKVGKKTVFLSPQAINSATGERDAVVITSGEHNDYAVHWRYEDYDAKKNTESVNPVTDKENTKNRPNFVVTPSKKSSSVSLSTPVRYDVGHISKASTPKEKNVERMKFWLAKGSTPIR